MTIYLLIFYVTQTGHAAQPLVYGPYANVAACERQRATLPGDNLLQRFAGSLGAACVQLKPLIERKT